jgi:hypothetical protein
MAGIEKAYFALEELEERWSVPHRDLAYLAESGILKVSVRLYGVRLERGSYQEGEQGPSSIPDDRSVFHGLQDLRTHDAYRLFQEGTLRVDRFDAPAGCYCLVLQPKDGIVIRTEELVVRREERDRVEAKQGLGGTRRTSEIVFEQRNDFTEVILGDHTFMLGPIQAGVVRVLHDAALRGVPWQHGKAVLAEAGSSCTRLSDLFKAQPEWRKLIQSDRRGRYRLNIRFS